MKNFDISIIMGSDSDLPVVKDCAKFSIIINTYNKKI